MPNLYADDTQIYGSCSPAAVNVLSSQISGCIGDVAAWMKSNRLQLDSDKTEVYGVQQTVDYINYLCQPC